MNPIIPVETLVVLLGATLFAVGLLSWRSSSRCATWRRVLFIALRCLGVCVLALIAINPGKWVGGDEERKSEWTVLVDRSSSMAEADVNGATRWAEAGRLAGKIQKLSSEPDKLLLRTFSSALENEIHGLDGMKPDGVSTDITGSGIAAMNLSRSAGRHLTGMILLTDGRQTVPESLAELSIRARANETPIYPLMLGGELAEKDISIVPARRHYMAFAGHKLKVAAVVSNKGMGRIAFPVRLFGPDGAKIDEQALRLDSGETSTVRFEIEPTSKGYGEYLFETPLREGERIATNNKAAIGVDVMDRRVKLLFIEGIPCWDTKFLVQLLREQSYLDVTSIYRLSASRFFKVDSDPSKAEESSESIFPDTAEALSAYDVIFLGRGVEYFLSEERVKLLKEFLKERGACVIFTRGKPYSSPMPELEPLEPMEWGDTLPYGFSLSPSDAGVDAGLFGEMLPGLGDPAWAKLKPLENSTRCLGLKPFAQVVAEGVFEREVNLRPFPLLVTQRFGRGIVSVVNAEGLWKWDFSKGDESSSKMYDEFWLRLLEWNMAYAEFMPGMSYAIRLSSSSALPGEPLRVKVTSRNGIPEGTQLKLKVIKDGVSLLELVPGIAGDGRSWESVFSLKEPGLYRVAVDGSDASETLLSIKAPPAEADNPSSDPDFLRKIADGSGGKMIDEGALPSLVPELEKGGASLVAVREIWRPAWNVWWLLLLALVPFALEWILRRRNGLL